MLSYMIGGSLHSRSRHGEVLPMSFVYRLVSASHPRSDVRDRVLWYWSSSVVEVNQGLRR